LGEQSKVTVEAVKSIYNSDEVNRVMPGKKDCTSTKVSGVKIHEQMQL
jgi:hypothetical protein